VRSYFSKVVFTSRSKVIKRKEVSKARGGHEKKREF
jgi:hypothetical protein